MKTIRWIACGLVLAAAAAVGASCGATQKDCTPSNCSGCCDSSGQCQAGSLPQACGLSGNTCQTCQGSDICTGGFCIPFSSGGSKDGGSSSDAGADAGSDGGTDGGTGCTAVSCPTGCCRSDGVCIQKSAQNNLTCGTDATAGTACRACTGTLTCNTSVGLCQDATCSGCVSSSGQCVALASQNGSQCGKGGVACVSCPSGTCSNGVCVSQTACNATTCPSGCCDSGGVCRSSNNAQCGVGGAACVACSTVQTCMSGTCQGAAQLGSPCATSADCAALGTGAICKKATSSNNATYQGGYCTRTCTANADCPGSFCLSTLAQYGEGDDFCAAPCGGGCRSGYGCYTFTSGDGCWISPLPTPPAAPSGLIGASCVSDSTCQNSGQYPGGSCIPESTSGSPSGWTGGYCFSGCVASPGTICGSTAACMYFDQLFSGPAVGLCLQRCGPGFSSCRLGYSCAAHPTYQSGGTAGANVSVCMPDCNDDAVLACNVGKTCSATTGLCQ